MCAILSKWSRPFLYLFTQLLEHDAIEFIYNNWKHIVFHYIVCEFSFHSHINCNFCVSAKAAECSIISASIYSIHLLWTLLKCQQQMIFPCLPVQGLCFAIDDSFSMRVAFKMAIKFSVTEGVPPVFNHYLIWFCIVRSKLLLSQSKWILLKKQTKTRPILVAKQVWTFFFLYLFICWTTRRESWSSSYVWSSGKTLTTTTTTTSN